MAAVCLRDGGLVDGAGFAGIRSAVKAFISPKGNLSGFRRWTLEVELCCFKSEQKDRRPPIIQIARPR